MDGTAGAAGVSTGTDPSRAAVADPAPAAVPAWVGRAVWRGIWQLIAAVLIPWPRCGSIEAGIDAGQLDLIDTTAVFIGTVSPAR
jgi:hypothetical protein